MLSGRTLIYFLFGLVACNNMQPVQHRYWDSREYFELETTRLKQQRTKLHKGLRFDGNYEQTQNDSPNWKHELDPFITIDLCKPGYSGRFTVDTLLLSDGEYNIEYNAKDTQTDLRSCSITSKQGKITSVKAEFGSKNTLYQSNKRYTYNSDSGYSISGYQNITLGRPVHYTIRGIFVSP